MASTKSEVDGKRRKTGGRQKGTPNKATGELKAMILQALDGVGGIDYLQARANDPKTAAAFMSLVGKVLPMQVTGASGGPLQHAVEITIVDPRNTAG